MLPSVDFCREPLLLGQLIPLPCAVRYAQFSRHSQETFPCNPYLNAIANRPNVVRDGFLSGRIHVRVLLQPVDGRGFPPCVTKIFLSMDKTPMNKVNKYNSDRDTIK